MNTRPQPLTPNALQNALVQHELDQAGWHVAQGALIKRFVWPDFNATMAFVHATAAYANQADHHPTLVVAYGSCEVHWATHDPLGITELDVASAAAASQIMAINAEAISSWM